MASAKGARIVNGEHENSIATIEHNKRVELQRQLDLAKREQRRLERERWKR